MAIVWPCNGDIMVYNILISKTQDKNHNLEMVYIADSGRIGAGSLLG